MSDEVQTMGDRAFRMTGLLLGLAFVACFFLAPVWAVASYIFIGVLSLAFAAIVVALLCSAAHWAWTGKGW